MTALNDAATIGGRRSLNAPPVGSVRRGGSGQRTSPAAQGSARAATPERQPAEPQRAPAAPAQPTQPATGNVDTSLRDRINRLSNARNNLLRRRGGAATADDAVTTATAPQMQTVEAAQREAAPAFDVPEDIEIETADEVSVGQVDLTRSAPPVPPAAGAPRAPEQRTPPREAAVHHPRQSARRRGDEDLATEQRERAPADGAGLPAARRSSAPDMARSTVRETTRPDRADASDTKSEIETLRREIADLRREVRDLREAGPGGLGPVERAVQRLSQRLDRLDGGAQPLLADGKLEHRKPKRGGFLGLFSRRR